MPVDTLRSSVDSSHLLYKIIPEASSASSLLRTPCASKFEPCPDPSAVLNAIGLNDVVEAVYDKPNESARDEGCWESKISGLSILIVCFELPSFVRSVHVSRRDEKRQNSEIRLTRHNDLEAKRV